ncbi:MAG: NYN domain-containing protein [Planctomycetes bacterium]|nr:NYN domain-containing protein [Planctomycetota bacterium]MCW8137431.1 NYN domain-containing protein [Planctomycetota bacterium]
MKPIDLIRRLSFFQPVPIEARPVGGVACATSPRGARLAPTTDLSPIDPFRKTAVVVDATNLLLSARDLGRGLDPARLGALLRLRCPGLLASAALGGHPPALEGWRAGFNRAGFLVVAQEAQFVAGRFKCDMDSVVGALLAKHAIRDRVGQVVLASGDADFVPLLRFARTLRRQPLRAVVLAVPGSLSRALEQEADDTVLLGADALPLPSASCLSA